MYFVYIHFVAFVLRSFQCKKNQVPAADFNFESNYLKNIFIYVDIIHV